MNNKVVQSLWIGGTLSTIEILTIKSFLANGHDFHLYTYGYVEGIPTGTTILDANTILSSTAIFKCSQGSYAIFADWFRWVLLRDKGGIWVDMDLVCIKPFDFEDDIVFGKQKFAETNVSILKFPAGHPLTKLMASVCADPTQALPYDKTKDKVRKCLVKLLPKKYRYGKWGSTGGPKGLTRAAKYFKLLEQAKPFTYFYPIHVTNWDAIFDDTFASDRLFENTYGVHLWNELLRKHGIDKNGTFSTGSLIEQFKSKYL